MDRAEIVAALSALGAALDSRGVRGEIDMWSSSNCS
jgi:hypothetical protein